MENKELLSKLQAYIDSKTNGASVVLNLAYSEESEGKTLCFTTSSDMPGIMLRVFEVNGDEVSELEGEDRQNQVRRYFTEIRPNQKFSEVVSETYESTDYEILIENRVDKAPTELKLRSNQGRIITLNEIYNLFDSSSNLFLVSTHAPSSKSNFLFTVLPDSKHLRLVTRKEPVVDEMLAKINELIKNRALYPLYATVNDNANRLNRPFTITAKDVNNNNANYVCEGRYDDLESFLSFAFFIDPRTRREIVGIINYKPSSLEITSPDKWTEEERNAYNKIREERNNNREAFNRKLVNVSSVNLNFLYEKFKKGLVEPFPLPTTETTNETK